MMDNEQLFKLMIAKQTEWRDAYMRNKRRQKRLMSIVACQKFKHRKLLAQLKQSLLDLEQVDIYENVDGGLSFMTISK